MSTNERMLTPKSVAIIGGGIAGLCAGIYAQMNGYRSRIYETHDLPGGLMTAWERKGYTIDYCIHWLLGSSPTSSMHKLWREVGLLHDIRIIDLDIWYQYEDGDGNSVTFWRDVDRLEEHLCEVSPADAQLVKHMLGDARRLARVDMPADLPPRELMRLRDSVRSAPAMIPWLLPARRWGKLSMGDLAARFQSPLLRDAFLALMPAPMGAMALLVTMAWLHAGNAGYPLGGSLPMARNLERRYLELGGEITYKTRVTRVVTQRTGAGDRAAGVELNGGVVEPAEIVVSAADGHATLYELLGGAYLDEQLRDVYEQDTLPLFSPILFVGVGVARDFAGEPQRISGLRFALDEPIGAGGVQTDLLDARIGNFDPGLAPAGKTVITSAIEADGPYWIELRERDRELYRAEKARIGDSVVRALDRRYHGLRDQVEMIDVATPATTVRYTGNWRASFEGFMPTPGYMMKGLPRRLPGLDDFYMVGQWVQPGGGLPTGVMTAREVLQLVCRRDGVEFRTTPAQ
jgi:phytoene dehydrogenase-like protein